MLKMLACKLTVVVIFFLMSNVLVQVLLYICALWNTSNNGNKYRIHNSFQIIERNTKMTITLKEDQIRDMNCSCRFFLRSLLKYYDTILSIFQKSQYSCMKSSRSILTVCISWTTIFRILKYYQYIDHLNVLQAWNTPV